MLRRPVLSAGRRNSLESAPLPAGLAARTASTTATTPAAGPAATTAATEAAATATALGFGPSFVNIERTAIEICSIERRDRAIRFGGVRHFDERKPARTAGVTVGYQVDTVHLSVRLKERTDGRFSCC